MRSFGLLVSFVFFSKSVVTQQLSLHLGGSVGNAQHSPASYAAPLSPLSIHLGQEGVSPSTPIATDGTVNVLSQNSLTQSPAVAQGTLTLVAPPAPTFIIDVSSLPASLPAINFTASSSFTLPSATVTATFNALPSNLVSKPYQMVLADTSNLPDYDWNLAIPVIPSLQKEPICAQQVAFCEKAGCEDPTAKLTNFCETDYMGSACYCSKGASRLQQYHWPVMLADCRGRNTACKDACIKPNSQTSDINICKTACDQNYGNNCGNPGQYAANYAVRKKGEKPNYSIVQGGNAQNTASSIKVNLGWVAGVFVVLTLFI